MLQSSDLRRDSYKVSTRPAPVVIVDYDPQWPIRYAQEKAAIVRALGSRLAAIEHIGSTAVPGLGAKPIIDMLSGVTNLKTGAQCVPALEALGYEYKGENGISGRLYFDKGNPRVYHLHMVEVDGEHWKRHLLFRDYLRSHPAETQRYEALKRELAERYGNDREGYTNAKTDFIEAAVRRAFLPF